MLTCDRIASICNVGEGLFHNLIEGSTSYHILFFFPFLLCLGLNQTAKESFELALEADNSNTHARYWLSKLHLKYDAPGSCRAM
uniref:Uncharacterized protein LOC105647918 isoform X1 n=1 Tax=Rhizophora mucronata TaxID=61149 RepID=A0A2P2JM75_RHIMU